jgi:xanthine dehydrogenase accessory factor
MATVVGTWRSAPRPAGASMLVGEDGTAVGSVSGGCVEGAVYELCTAAIATGEPRLQRYGISDDDAFEVGLTCGGIIDLWVEKVSPQTYPELGAVLDSIESGEPVAVVTCIEGPHDRLGRRLVVWNDRRAGGLGSNRLDDAVADDIRGMLAGGRTGIVHYGYDGERRGDALSLFVASHAPRPRMLVFGAIDFAAAVARVGHFLGYRVTVCDARPVFATAKRFPDADEVIVDWPHRYLAGEVSEGRVDARTVVCVLTHDPKFDVPVLEVALRQDFAYVGAMGSRRTHDEPLPEPPARDGN